MTRTREPEISWFHQSGRESGVSWWGERPTWARHVTYWVVALGLLSPTMFDADEGPTTASNDDLLTFAWFVMGILAIAVAALIFTLREWNSVGLVRTVSRSLVLFTFILGFAASWLYFARRFGVEINACRLIAEQEICRDQASPQQVLGMLSWQAADVVPVLQITDSFGWDRPARSESTVVGAAVVIIRLWLAIGVLAIVKRIWDGWGATSSTISPTPTR
ncbi:MAG: hypothetical protein ACRDJT_11050 [Actinomycetota bacterium]